MGKWKIWLRRVKKSRAASHESLSQSTVSAIRKHSLFLSTFLFKSSAILRSFCKSIYQRKGIDFLSPLHLSMMISLILLAIFLSSSPGDCAFMANINSTSEFEIFSQKTWSCKASVSMPCSFSFLAFLVWEQLHSLSLCVPTTKTLGGSFVLSNDWKEWSVRITCWKISSFVWANEKVLPSDSPSLKYPTNGFSSKASHSLITNMQADVFFRNTGKTSMNWGWPPESRMCTSFS